MHSKVFKTPMLLTNLACPVLISAHTNLINLASGTVKGTFDEAQSIHAIFVGTRIMDTLLIVCNTHQRQ